MAQYIIDSETLTSLADAIRGNADDIGLITIRQMIQMIRDFRTDIDIGKNMIENTHTPTIRVPFGAKKITGNCMRELHTDVLVIPESVVSISSYSIQSCSAHTVQFIGRDIEIGTRAFASSPNITTINVPWGEEEIAGAPWGATNATIVYNYIPPEEEVAST